MRKFFALIFAIILIPSLAYAQRATIPTFPDDEAELVDPGSLDVPSAATTTPSTSSSTTTPTTTTATTPTVAGSTTTIVADSGTGTPTMPVITLSLIGAVFTLTAARFIHKKSQR